MAKEQFILTIKKDASGQDVDLNNMTLEVAEAFKELLESFMGLARLHSTNSDSQSSETRISVSRGSAILAIEASTENMESLVTDMKLVFKNESRRKETVSHCKKIQTILKSLPYEYEMGINNSQHSQIDFLQEFKRTKSFYTKRTPKTKRISELEFVNGELIDLGGKKINFHIMPRDKDDAIIVNCKTKEQARKLGKFVYSQAFVVVHTKKRNQSKPIREFVDYYSDVNQFNQYKEFYDRIQELEGQERYTEFHELIFQILNTSQDLDLSLRKIRKYVRLFDHSWTESGQLRTILVSLKAFRNNIILQETLNGIKDRLKTITGQDKI